MWLWRLTLLFIFGLLFASPALAVSDVELIDRGLLLLGKLHPAIVHFPLAFLIAALMIECAQILRGKRSTISQAGRYCLLAGTVGVLFASAAGWLNSQHQEFQGSLLAVLDRHQNLAVLTYAFATLAYCASSRAFDSSRFRFTYRALLLGAGVCVGLGSHFGGVMVHGEDYYADVFGTDTSTKVASSELVPHPMRGLPEVSLKRVHFENDIYPILKRSCYRCHGGGKKKGDFQIDTRDQLLRGGKKGPAVVVGESDRSYLIKLVSGLEPDNLMPEKGRELTDSEVGLLRAWIDQGVAWNSDDGEGDVFMRAMLNLRHVKVPRKKGISDSSNPIDRLLDEYFARKKVQPGELVNDSTFLRRVYLDTVGYYPSPEELESFLEDNSTNKRETIVSELLSRNEAYADNWLSFWNDLLRNDYSGTGYKSRNKNRRRKQITGWLRKSLVNNMPYDRMVALLIAPHGRSDGFARGLLWSGVINPNERPEMQMAQNIGQVFLGINLKCASCHDSFTDEWTLQDAYGLANVYAKEPLETHRCDVPTGEFVSAKFLFPELGEINNSLNRSKRTKELAKIITSTENGRLARTLVNRIWAKLYGRGIVEPVDAMSDKPWDQDLLDWLAVEFVHHSYDIKHLLKLMLTSHAYQMKSVDLERAPSGSYVFRGPLRRRISAEQFMDTLIRVTDTYGEIDREDIFRAALYPPPGDYSKSRQYKSKIGKRLGKKRPRETLVLNIEGAKSLWLTTSLTNRVGLKTGKVFEGHGIWANPRLVRVDGSTVPLHTVPVHEGYSATEEGYSLRISQVGEVSQVPKKFLKDVRFGFVVKPFSYFRFQLPDGEFAKFETDIVADLAGKQKKRLAMEFVAVRDVEIRASLLQRNPLLAAFGRPVREQVVTTREEQMTTLAALNLSNGPEMSTFLSSASERLAPLVRKDPVAFVFSLYQGFLGRSPNVKELELATQLLKEHNTEGIQDFVWALVMSPEFQLIG